MLEQLIPWMNVVGRVMFATIFIANGMNHFMKLNDMSAYAQGKGVPSAKALTMLTGLMMIVGGVLLALGTRRLIGAGLIVLFLLPTAVMMHSFWNETDPQQRANEMAHFMKNLALAGAALVMASLARVEWPMALPDLLQ